MKLNNKQTNKSAYVDITFSRWDIVAEVCELVNEFSTIVT